MTQTISSVRDTNSTHETLENNALSSQNSPANQTNGVSPNGAVQNGVAANDISPNGAQNNGASHEIQTPDVRPDVQETVVMAARIAQQRHMPLRPDGVKTDGAKSVSNGIFNINGSGNANGNGAQSGNNGVIEYSNLRTDLNGRPRVDILATLAQIAPQMQEVETEIERLITSPVKLVSDIASHTLGAGGKRLRPALTLFAAQLCGDSPEKSNARAVTCAAVMELTHTTALIHDDVVDNAQTRRGKPAANLVWGNETSVLVGDYLCAQAFITVAKPEFRDVLPYVAQATAELCAGELLETQTRGLLTMSEAQYFDIIALKTASLTGCACRVGAITANASDEQQEFLARYGRDLGLAFQIVDDVFDAAASEARIGKPVGNDIREGDITLPMLRAMQVCAENEREELREIVGKDPISDDEVARALEIVRGCDAIEYSLQMAQGFVASAKSQLASFEDGAAKNALLAIADYVLSRDK